MTDTRTLTDLIPGEAPRVLAGLGVTDHGHEYDYHRRALLKTYG